MKMSRRKKLSFIIGGTVIAVLSITGIVLASTGIADRLVRISTGRVVDTLPPPPPPRTVTIAAVGDIMMGTDYPGPKLPPGDGELLYEHAAPVLRAVDIAFGNLEGPITSSTGCTKKTGSGKSFAFRCPPRLAKNLLTAGFDVMSLANNHSRDFGYAGMAETKRILDSLGIAYSSKVGEVAEFVVDSLDIALIAFSTGSTPRSILNIEMCLSEVEKLAPKYDILIISFHGGTEGTKALHTTYKFENLYGEPRGNVIEFAHRMIDAGADMVIGHGPHVPRGMEIYKDKLIAYSLGNFCTYRCMQLVGELGYAPLLVAEVDSVGNFLRGEIHSFRQFPPGGPSFDSSEAAFRLMRDLSLVDFPQSAPRFADSKRFFPTDADSTMSAEELRLLRDSLDARSIVEPDTVEPELDAVEPELDAAEPELDAAVDSFLTAGETGDSSQVTEVDSVPAIQEKVDAEGSADTSSTIPEAIPDSS